VTWPPGPKKRESSAYEVNTTVGASRKFLLTVLARAGCIVDLEKNGISRSKMKI